MIVTVILESCSFDSSCIKNIFINHFIFHHHFIDPRRTTYECTCTLQNTEEDFTKPVSPSKSSAAEGFWKSVKEYNYQNRNDPIN